MCDTNSVFNLLGNITVGVFTLAAALGGIWLKDYLENKKHTKSSLRQKAIEAYGLANRIMYSLNTMQVICANLLSGDFHKNETLYQEYPDESATQLEKLELLIIENFYELKPLFDKVNYVIVERKEFLVNIIIDVPLKKCIVSKTDFETKRAAYVKEIVDASSALRGGLINNYINKK